MAVATFLLSACLLDPDQGGSKTRPWDGTPGYVNFQVKLERNENNGLGKVSVSDTTFGLDSLLIVLSATGADTVTYRYPISGRPDTGAIAISPKIYTLNPLLTWKARIYSIDTTVSPTRRDTVHIDSVSFVVHPADTTVVSKTVNPAFSVLHARFLSQSDTLLGSGIFYVRILVDSVTRDSSALYSTRSFNAVNFPSLTTGWAVQDTGRIYRSTDSGKSWYPQASGTTTNLRSVFFANTSLGWVVGEAGLVRKTTNGGSSWSTQSLGTSRRLNRVHFVSTTTGYVAGDSGAVYKTTDGGTTWSLKTGGWFPQASGTPYGLNDVQFTLPALGIAVGYGGVIRGTVDAGGTWQTITSPVAATLSGLHFPTTTNGWAVGDTGKVIVTTGGGGSWAEQTSRTRKDLTGVHFNSATVGWASGKNETLLRTTDGGATWLNRSSGWADQTSNTTTDLKSVHFTGAGNGIAVGSAGEIRRSTTAGVDWSGVTSNTTRNLHDVHFSGSNDGLAVGDSETVVRSADAGASWTAQAKSGWFAQTSGTSSNLNSVHFTAAGTGIAVGASGTVKKTTNNGSTWDAPVAGNGSTTLNDVHFSGTSAGWAVGDSETVLRTGNTGANWTAAKGGWFSPTTDLSGNLNAVHFTSATTGWSVGAGGSAWKTTNNGVTWASQSGNVSPSNTNALEAVHATSTSNVVAVGDGESILRTVNGGTSWNYYPVGFAAKSSGITNTINAVRFVDNTNGWAVADSGKILKSTDRGESWSQPWAATNKKPLRGVFGWGQNHAVVAGDSGIIKRTSDGGANWTAMTSGVTTDLRGLYFTGATGWAVGGTGGTVRFTNDSGKTWATQTGAGGTLNAVYSNGSRVWMVGDGGIIYRNTGITNSALSSVTNGAITAENLYGVYFTSSNVGYIVGQGGLIAKCTNTGNTNWTLRTSGVGTDLRHIFFKGNGGAANDTGYAVGDGGVILRTHDTGMTWTRLASGTNENLRAVFLSTTNRDTVISVGANGKIVKTITGGTWSGRTPQNLNDVFFYSASGGFAVGDSGTILRTNNTAASWTPLKSRVVTRLNAVFSDATRAWAVGDGSVVRHIAAITDTGWTSAAGDLPASVNLYAVHFTTSTRGYVAGADGKIFMTTNNGTNWTQQGSGVTSDTLYSLNFKGTGTNDTGYATGKSGTILRTVNGGTNWVKLISGTNEILRGVQTNVSTTSVDTTYAVGANGTLLKTINRGSQWSGLVSKQAYQGVHLYSTTSGFAVGDSGAIIRSTNSGANWTALTSGVSTRLNGVYSDGTRAWAVGDNSVVRHIAAIATTSWSALTNSPPAGKRLFGVHFTSATVGYVVGSDGVIYKTTDNGATAWVQQGSGVTSDTLVSVSFRGSGTNDTGYAVGKNGTVLRTVNGGSSWVKLVSGTNEDLAGVFTNVSGTSVDTTYAVGATGTVLKTIARGGSWSRRVSPQTVRSVYLYSTTAGFAVGDSGFSVRTTNNGGNWLVSDSGITTRLNSVYSDGTRAWAVGMGGVVRYASALTSVPWASASGTMPATANLYGTQFLSSTVGYAVGYNTSGSTGVVYKTTNNGTNWTALTLGVTVSDTLRSVFFKGTGGASDTGYVVGDTTILYTTNSGTNWTRHLTGNTNRLYGVHAGAGGSMDTAFAVGAGGTVLKTYNAGRLFSGDAERRDFLGVHFPTSTVGYVFGTGSTILKSTDAGVSWTTQSNPAELSGDYLYSGYFISADTGWAVGSGGKILKTTNGSTWTAQTSGTTEFLYRVKFLNRDTGWVVGHSTILKTTNGGTDWVAQNSGTSAYLSGLSITNKDSVVAVGFGEATGTILKTRNGGAANIGTANLNGVFARNDSVYVVGNGATAYRSRDGGASWTPLTGATQNLNAVYSTGKNTYIAGDAGQIVTIPHDTATTGMFIRTSNTVQNLKGVWGSPSGASSRLYVVGDSGTIRYLTGSVTNSWNVINPFVNHNFKDIHCGVSAPTTHYCWAGGENEIIARSFNVFDWYTKTKGPKTFDVRLGSKYVRPGVSTEVVIQAIDNVNPVLRGYQKILNVTVGAGQDSTLNTQMTPCGYDLTPACRTPN